MMECLKCGRSVVPAVVDGENAYVCPGCGQICMYCDCEPMPKGKHPHLFAVLRNGDRKPCKTAEEALKAIRDDKTSMEQ